MSIESLSLPSIDEIETTQSMELQDYDKNNLVIVGKDILGEAFLI